MELKVNEIQALEPIKFNYEELKSNLTANLEKYKDLVYTEENIKEAKNDRALLNKVTKAINDEKKRIKSIVLAPYIDFESKCKELMEMVEVIAVGIDTQIKDFEQKQKNEKTQEILTLWINNAEEFQELIDIDTIFNEQWLNKTYGMSKVEADIKHIIDKTKMDLETLNSTIIDDNINKRVKDFYFKNISNPSVLSLAIQESRRIEEANKKITAMESSQEVVKSKENITNSLQNIAQNEGKQTKSEELKQLDFRVWVTAEQMQKLKDFLKTNKIKYGKVE